MEPRESDSPADDARASPGFNPRLVPPLILGGLLLIVGLLAILSRGGPSKDAHGERVEPSADDRGDSLAAHGHGGTLPHGGMGPHGAAADLKIPQLQKADGGQTLAEVAAAPEKFGGREIKVRGIIIKAQQRVRPALGQPATNWYRLQDSSGAAEPLLFTTDDAWQQGDIVVIAGRLTLDRDFGGGLRYKMIVERPSVTREKSPAAAEAPAKTAGPDPKTKG